MQYDVAIIGAGPCGASAAIIIARAKLNTLVVDADKGMTRMAMVNNHLGLLEVTGPAIVERGHEQLQKAGAHFEKAQLTSLSAAADGFTLVDDSGRSFSAKQIVLCLGANPAVGKDAGVVVAAGVEPYIKEVFVVDAQGRTNIDGVWAAGTCAGTSVHTIVTAGDGARVAFHLVSALKGERYVDHDVLA